jgi:hypothetical protein
VLPEVYSGQVVENVAGIASRSVTLRQVSILHEAKSGICWMPRRKIGTLAGLDISSECIIGNWLHNSAVFIFIPLNIARKPPCSFISSWCLRLLRCLVPSGYF